MLPQENPYNANIPELSSMQQISQDEITKQLNDYLKKYREGFTRSQQSRYFETFVKGLLNNLERKSIEPIALSFLGERDVRGMQQFFTRSKGWDEAVKQAFSPF